MTDNLPAVRQEAAVAAADTDSWIQVMGPLTKLADAVATTEFVPKNLRGKPAAVAAALLYGREVGLPPMTALTMTHVVEGRPAMSAEGMRALVLAAGHDLDVLDATGGIVRMRGRRRGSENWTTVEWSIDMARAAGLLGKDNWKNYPRAMLTARCTAELCRLVFPDVIHGFRATEELDDDPNPPVAQPEPAATPAGTTVRRARATKKTAPAELPAGPRERPQAPAGPPLPGEPGFEQLAGPPAEQPSEDAGEPPSAGPASSEPVTVEEGDPDAEGDTAEHPQAQDPSSAATPEPTVDETHAPDRGSRRVSKAQLSMLHASFNGIGVKGEDYRERRLGIVSRIVGHDVESTADLTTDEASAVIDTIARVRTLPDLEALLDAQDRA